MVQMLDYLCCDPLSRDSHDDDSITCSTDEGILECDYDTQVTKLYHGIEERQWEEVLYFLETGNWYASSIFSAFGNQGEKPAVQAKTWVTALDDEGNVRWCQLPLHAAVTFLAPFSIIRKLVEIYPKSVRCADDQDMLPLHYAFRFGVDDDVLVHLLEKFPQAVSKKAVKDRLPLDLAQYGPRPERGILIDYYMQSAVRHAKTEWDGEFEKMVSNIKEEADQNLEQELEEKRRKLSDTLNELVMTRRELEALKLAEGTDAKAGAIQSSTVSVQSRRSATNKSTKSAVNNKNSTNGVRRSRSKPPTANKKKKTGSISDESSMGNQSRGRSRSRGRQPSDPPAQTELSTSVKRGLGQIFGKRKK